MGEGGYGGRRKAPAPIVLSSNLAFSYQLHPLCLSIPIYQIRLPVVPKVTHASYVLHWALLAQGPGL